MTREGVLAAALAVSAVVLGCHWWAEGEGQVPPPGAPRAWSEHELRVCRKMMVRAMLADRLAPAEKDRLWDAWLDACGPGRPGATQ